MQTSYECLPCLINGVIGLFKRDLIEEKYQEQVLREALKYYSEVDFKDPPLLISRNLHRLVRKISGNNDPYKQLKDEFNEKALQYYDKYREQILNSEDPFDRAMRLAIAGNIIDFGPGHVFDMEETIEKVMNSPFTIDDSAAFRQSVQQAESILYLADNTGEIVFDKLFLEVMNHPNVTLAVRERPVLNDATIEDIQYLGIDKMVKVITNGDDAPGTLLQFVSDEFRQVYESADLVISKGQGNFEGLGNITDKNIFFLLMVKCNVIGAGVELKKGDYVVKSALKETIKI